MEFKRDIEIVKGDSSPILNISMTDYILLADDQWVGRLVVTSKLGTGVYLVDKQMSIDQTNKYFLAYLTPDESNLIPVGEYYLVCEVKNSNIVPPVRLETQYRLKILESGIINS